MMNKEHLFPFNMKTARPNKTKASEKQPHPVAHPN